MITVYTPKIGSTVELYGNTAKITKVNTLMKMAYLVFGENAIGCRTGTDGWYTYDVIRQQDNSIKLLWLSKMM